MTGLFKKRQHNFADMKWYFITVIFMIGVLPAKGKDYHYEYTGNCARAYSYYMSLQPEKGRDMLKKELISDPYNLMATYISDYDDCLLLLFNGNATDYQQLKHHQEQRIKLLERGNDSSPWHRLCKAGVYMHWAFVNIRFNENFKAATNFRKSYMLLQENKKLFPSFKYNDIFLGIEEATVGAMPDNYKWVASIFGMKGNVQAGVNKVRDFIKTHDGQDPLYNEAVIYYAYLCFYVLSDKEQAWAIVNNDNFETENNLVNSFVKCNIALNNRKAGEAVNVLSAASKLPAYSKYPIFEYEYGYALLHKLDNDAITRYRSFLNSYKGSLFIKDAWQKLAFAHYLEGDTKMATYCKNKIITAGSSSTDSDKQALRFARQQQWPDKTLLKAQLLTDGGYYKDAYTLLAKTDTDDYANRAYKLEYYFRLGRVLDETNRTDAAIEYYNKAITTGKDMQEQFAARAALQLGFLYERRHNKEQAIAMYKTALNMENHDFKNSIDQQAKAGINRLQK